MPGLSTEKQVAHAEQPMRSQLCLWANGKRAAAADVTSSTPATPECAVKVKSRRRQFEVKRHK